MGERAQKHMPTERLVGLMEGTYINMSIFPITTLRDSAMEEVHHRDIHTT